MNRIHSPALVLRRWPFSEHSLIAHVLTPGHGTLSLMAKGAFRLKSGFAGVLDTWSLVEIEVGPAAKDGLHQLYQAKLLDRMSGLSNHSHHLVVAGILAELAELGAPAGQPSARLFLWLQQWLQRLSEGWPADPSLVAALLDGLDALGLGPRLAAPEEQSGRSWFSPALGGAIRGPRPEDHVRPYPPAVQEQLELLSKAPQKAQGLNNGEVLDSRTILGEFLHYHLERPPKAWALLHGQHTRRPRSTHSS